MQCLGPGNVGATDEIHAKDEPYHPPAEERERPASEQGNEGAKKFHRYKLCVAQKLWQRRAVGQSTAGIVFLFTGGFLGGPGRMRWERRNFSLGGPARCPPVFLKHNESRGKIGS